MDDFHCHDCERRFGSPDALRQHNEAKHPERVPEAVLLSQDDPEVEPDWQSSCEVCGQSPILPITGMCGPCTFGEADTLHGGW